MTIQTFSHHLFESLLINVSSLHSNQSDGAVTYDQLAAKTRACWLDGKAIDIGSKDPVLIHLGPELFPYFLFVNV